MIYKVYSDKECFRPVNLKPGFNVILAERTKESAQKDSRNGLGKTTLLEIIHFCLGSSPKKGEGLPVSQLKDWTFFIDIDLNRRKYTVSRNTKNRGNIFISGDFTDFPIQPNMDKKTGKYFYKLNDWKDLLGNLMFNLNTKLTALKYKPTFRSLISYFARRGRDAFSNPFEYSRKPPAWNIQVNNAFLLGLEWEDARKWQVIKDKEKTLNQLKKAISEGLVKSYLGSIGELEAKMVQLEEKAGREHEQLDTFKVHPQYRDIDQEASSITRRIHNLTNETIRENLLLELYRSSIKEERSASTDEVIKIYKETGKIMPQLVVKRLRDVQNFHHQVTINRKDFLTAEIDRLIVAIKEKEDRIRLLSEKRADLMMVLKTHGALEEYTKLQQRYLETVSKLDEIKLRIDDIKKLEKGKSALRIDKENLQMKARADYEERSPIWKKAILLFNSNSESLYKAPGKLIIDITSEGFKFNVEIERSGSQGFEQMKVFCYDLMLAQLWSEKKYNPGFLIHDSTIFDGVDERQVANALQAALKESIDHKFQYICCLNSDRIPRNEFDEDFNMEKYISHILTDTREDGTLLGIRF